MCGLPSKTSAFQNPTPAIIPASGKVLFNASNRGVMTRRSPMSLLRSTKIFCGATGGFRASGQNRLNEPTSDSNRLLRQLTFFLPDPDLARPYDIVLTWSFLAKAFLFPGLGGGRLNRAASGKR